MVTAAYLFFIWQVHIRRRGAFDGVSHVRVHELILVASCIKVYVGHGNEMSPEMRSR